MTLATGNHVAVGEEREGVGDREARRDAEVDQRLTDPRLHGAGDQQHRGVVDDLHDRDRDRVRRQRDGHDGGEAEPGLEEGQRSQAEAEDIGESNGKGDGRQVAPAKRCADEHAQELTDHAAGEAVRRRAGRESVEISMGRRCRCFHRILLCPRAYHTPLGYKWLTKWS